MNRFVSGKGFWLLLCIFLLSCHKNKTIKWWTTTDSKCWEEQRNLIWTKNETLPDTTDASITIYPDSTQQTIHGFGGCFNELGWDALNTLPEPRKAELLKKIFDHDGDLKFSVCRIPIGASDYARNYYSLNDSARDYTMEYFSTDRDLTGLIPYIKAAKDIQNNLTLWASPWTPPAWMKTNNNYACASAPVNNLPLSGQGKEGTNQIKENDTILNAYAKYFVKFIKEYARHDINISAVQVQNEFNSCQVFPSCVWKPSLLAKFIGQFLGPQFAKNKIQTEIWLGTIERPAIENIDTVLTDSLASQYIKGLGFQWGGKGAIALAHKKYPEMPLMQTESECGNGSNNWMAAEHTFGLMKHYFNAGANCYMYWNMMLEKSGKSSWSWKQNALVSIDTTLKKYTLNPEYYLFKHFSNLVKNNSILVKTNRSSADLLAFITPQKVLVIVVANRTNKKKNTHIIVNNQQITIALLPHSFNTLQCYNIKYVH